MSDLPRQIRLAAGDYFMHGQDSRMRQVGQQGNICCAIIKLGGGFDVERLRRRVAESPFMDWLARARVTRPWLVLPPCWTQTTAPQAIFFDHVNQNGSLPTPWSVPEVVAKRELHAKRGPGLAFDVLRHQDGTSHLFLSWNHTYLDARGLEMLLQYLNADEPANGAVPAPNFINPKQRESSLSGWWSNVKKARGSIKWLDASGDEPLFSLVPPGPRRQSCQSRYQVIYFTAEETARIDARCEQHCAGFRRSHFYCAASIRAVHNLAVKRGNEKGAYLIPVPHDTRRRGSKGPIFSNHLSILFYRIEPQHAGSMTAIFPELSRQMSNQIGDRFPEACMAALDMFKPLPLWMYVNHLGKPTRGKFATFSFSDAGETCAGMTELWGGKILEVTHLVPAWRPPGLTVVFLRFGNRLSALLSYVDDCLTPAEVDAMERDLRFALLEEPA